MTTIWHPDTCACVIEYDGVDEATGDLVNPRRIKTCMKHADLDGGALADRLLKHNRWKNLIVNEAIERGADAKTVKVTYTPSDGLVISGTGWGANKINLVNAALEAKFPNRNISVVS